MNEVRRKILDSIKPYKEFSEHKDLIAFSLGESYLYREDELEEDVCGDFEELIVVVEKDWLFNHMKEEGFENPLNYLQNEYTWDDSIEWFYSAVEESKVVMVDFY